MPNREPHPARRLPRQPNLEQLRKQARDLLLEYRAGDPAAVEEVRQFERHPDPAAFALHDAQRVLARAYGYQSWARLKAFVDGANVARLAEAVQAGDVDQARALLRARPELASMDMAGDNEHQALHYAVLRRDRAMVRLLMAAGADARKGIFPHRDATTALALARERGYEDIVSAIEEEEQHRRETMSCPNATVSPVQDQINRAIRDGDNAAAMRLLEADESLIRACDRDGTTALHAAAAAMNPEMVGWLLHKRANARKADLHGWTPLDRAALAARAWDDGAKHFPEVARLLLAHGADLTVRAALALNDGEHVRELVEADPGVLREIRWQTGGLLTLAVKHGHMEMVRLLLDLGADVDERTTLAELEEPTLSWGSPLWHASRSGRHDIAGLLLDRGADPNGNVYASGWPIDHAYRRHDDAMKQLLLNHGATPQPWTIAMAQDVAEARRMLEADSGEELAREFVWSAACNGCPAIVELALPRLQWAADDPRWHWILIQPVRSVGDREDDADFFACMALLLRHGIDPNVTRRGETALHYTAARANPTGAQRVRFAAMLLDRGARLDVRDELLQSTPLGWACRWGRRELAELLIERGAAVNEPDAEPWATPLAWAEKMGHAGIAGLLRQRGAKR
ncbi:MAG TPA: ankyrin repeat domain-containing protein [Bryobacteraceae bacterium]|jgi:ankyrin repeat protein|nr:ankyrin repeat domain-containing protein [Bryobacteraceae bacterium]